MSALPTVEIASFILPENEVDLPVVKCQNEDTYTAEIRDVHLMGHTRNVSALLVSFSDDGSFKPEARVRRKISFRSLADVQMHVKRQSLPVSISHVKSAIDELGDLFTTRHSSEGFPVLPPPSFAREHVPRSLQRQYFHKKTPELRRGESTCPWAIDYIATTPICPLEAHLSGSSLYERLCELFDQRPCWTKIALRNMLSEDQPQAEFKRLLTKVAYTFVNGPWRNVWVKYGVDPRSNPGFRMFQVLELRNTYNTKKIIRTRRGIMTSKTTDSNNPTQEANLVFNNHVFDGDSLSDNFFVYQLCDIVYQPVRDYLCKAEKNLQTYPSDLDGWFPSSTISAVRDIIKLRIESLLKSHVDEEYFFSDITPSDAQPIANDDISEDEYEVWA